jgi:aryl-alcohol dehydrogenase-like predicted oxidoreductase
MTTQAALGGSFTFPGTTLTVHRMGYGAMQLAGPHVGGPPRDEHEALSVLREAVASGVNHIDTSDFFSRNPRQSRLDCWGQIDVVCRLLPS